MRPGCSSDECCNKDGWNGLIQKPHRAGTTMGAVEDAVRIERETSIAELERMHRGAKEVLDRERRAMNERVRKITQYNNQLDTCLF